MQRVVWPRQLQLRLTLAIIDQHAAGAGHHQQQLVLSTVSVTAALCADGHIVERKQAPYRERDVVTFLSKGKTSASIAHFLELY